MRTYLDIVGGAHAALGGLVVASGMLVALLPLGMVAYGLWDFVNETGYGAFGRLRGVLFLSTVIGVPCALILAAGAVELFAGVGILRRWRSGWAAGFVAAVASLWLGLPGMVLALGTIVVLLDADVKREFV